MQKTTLNSHDDSKFVLLFAAGLVIATVLFSLVSFAVISRHRDSVIAFDLLGDSLIQKNIKIAGFSFPSEVDTSLKTHYSWGEGTKGLIVFSVRSAGKYYLELSFSSPIAGQSVRISVNGKTLSYWKNLPGDTEMRPTVSETVLFDGKDGLNTIQFDYDFCNGYGSRFSPDPRCLNIAFLKLRIGAVDGGARE